MSMDMDVSESSSILEALSNSACASEEQWASFLKQNGLLDEYSDEEYMSDRSISPLGKRIVDLVAQDGSLSEDSDEDQEQISWGCSVADRYAQGKLSIDELKDIISEDKYKGPPSKKQRISKEGKSPSKEAKPKQSQEKKKKRKSRRKKHVLSPAHKHIMGAANTAYAEGNLENAIKLCMELIRIAPNASEPFHTLGLIYEDKGENRKAFQSFLVSAFLNPGDTEEWIRLAQLSVERNDLQTAIDCYTKAIRNEKHNTDLLFERNRLYDQLGQWKNSLAGCEQIIKHLTQQEDAEECIALAKEISKFHHEHGSDSSAAKILETAFTKFPSHVKIDTFEALQDINFLIELQISQNMFKPAIKTFMLHCDVKLKMPLGELQSYEDLKEFESSDFEQIESCTFPDQLPIDLFVKFLICLIRLKATKAAQPLYNILLNENPEDNGDLFLDTAEVLMDMGEHMLAKEMLYKLTQTAAYNLPAVWMKYADALYALNEVESAVAAYKTVIQLAPGYQDARLTLSKIFLESGLKDEATNVLGQELNESTEGVVLGADSLYQRCKLLESEKRWDEYVKTGTLLQYSHCYMLETAEDIDIILSSYTVKRRHETMKDLKLQGKRNFPEFVGGKNIPCKEMYGIFKKICEILFESKRFEDLQTLSLAVLSSTLFIKVPEIAKEMDFQALLGCFFNKKYHYCYKLMKYIVLKHMNSNMAWNLFGLITTLSQENCHTRFCIRLMMKHQDHVALALLNGHSALIAGTYKHALGEYMCMLKEHPNDPRILFYVGITFIHLASQKFSVKRHLLTIQGIAFLKRYMIVQGESQETYYNIGRALHQLGIKDAAIFYYKKALLKPPIICENNEAIFDLRKEIAFNLALIYQSTGAMDLVYLYTRKYIVV